MIKSETPSSGGKLKRKDPHPVRREFLPTSDTQYQCMHCSWTTCMNATRMVKHIVEQCSNVPENLRDEMATIQQAALEKERNSSLVNENKKDIHGLFNIVDTKRVCMFCDWSTVRNLTRMRNHIALQCSKVPLKVRACFLKDETAAFEAYKQEQEHVQEVESYQVVTLDEGQWGDAEIQLVNTTDNPEQDDQLTMDENYLEVQELEERNCCWCGKALTYASCEVEDGSEVFCSSRCFQRHADQMRKTTKSPTPPPSQKRKMPMDSPKAAQAPPKQIKVVVVSGAVVAQEASVKQEPFNTSNNIARRDNSESLIEVLNYSPEQDAESLPEETPQPVLEEPVRKKVMQKSASVQTVASRKSLVKMRRLTPVAKPAMVDKATLTAATEEGSCHSYAGGHVYPQEDRLSADHKLQWTKAVISRPAPQFEATAVVEGAFKKIKLSDYRGKYLVFFFYPLDFTFVCPTEILAFSDRAKEFQKLNTEVIAASIDSHFTHLAWINTPRKEGGLGKINIPLVSDITHSIAKDYGVYLDDLGHTLRGLFIIDDRGILRQITMNDLPVGRSVDETLRLVQAFQYTDKHGEVCPAGWKPGQDTIVPNPEEKIKYFEKNH